MFRTGLLISTAMTAVTLLLSGAPAPAQRDMHVASRDPNTRFLCTFGQFGVSAASRYQPSRSHYGSAWEHVAVPVTGQGQTVRRIKVIEGQDISSFTQTFAAGIYSDTPSGLPGRPIAVGTGKAHSGCGPITIAIPQTKLKRRTTYWIEETISTMYSCLRGFNCSSSANVSWQADPNAKRKAYVQYRRLNWSAIFSSYTSPWTKQSTGPYFKLK